MGWQMAMCWIARACGSKCRRVFAVTPTKTGETLSWPGQSNTLDLLLVVEEQPFPCQLLEARARLAVIGKRVDGNAPARRELAEHLDVLRVHQRNQVFHDDVDAVLMEVAVVAEAEQIQLERLALHHLLRRDVADDDGGEVRLAGDGAQTGELRADELHEVVVARVLVVEGFEYVGGVVGAVLGALVA